MNIFLFEFNSLSSSGHAHDEGFDGMVSHHETALGRVREKAKLAEEELFELRNWNLVTEQKLKLAEQARDEF